MLGWRGVGGGRLPGSYVYFGALSGRVRVVLFLFVLRGTCWGCLSHDGEGAGLLDGFVSRWPCGHDTVAHHVLSRRLS